MERPQTIESGVPCTVEAPTVLSFASTPAVPVEQSTTVLEAARKPQPFRPRNSKAARPPSPPHSYSIGERIKVLATNIEIAHDPTPVPPWKLMPIVGCVTMGEVTEINEGLGAKLYLPSLRRRAFLPYEEITLPRKVHARNGVNKRALIESCIAVGDCFPVKLLKVNRKGCHVFIDASKIAVDPQHADYCRERFQLEAFVTNLIEHILAHMHPEYGLKAVATDFFPEGNGDHVRESVWQKVVLPLEEAYGCAHRGLRRCANDDTIVSALSLCSDGDTTLRAALLAAKQKCAVVSDSDRQVSTWVAEIVRNSLQALERDDLGEVEISLAQVKLLHIEPHWPSVARTCVNTIFAALLQYAATIAVKADTPTAARRCLLDTLKRCLCLWREVVLFCKKTAACSKEIELELIFTLEDFFRSAPSTVPQDSFLRILYLLYQDDEQADGGVDLIGDEVLLKWAALREQSALGWCKGYKEQASALIKAIRANEEQALAQQVE